MANDTTRQASSGEAPSLAVVVAVVAGPGAGRLAELPVEQRIVIGKAPPAQFVLPYSGVSRRHLTIRLTSGGAVMVRDLDSTNGTYLDGEPLTGTARVQLGQRIALGAETILSCRLVSEAEHKQLELQAGASRRLALLSAREREVALLVAQGGTSAEIAEQLELSPRTVSKHLDHIYTRLDIPNRSALTRLVVLAAQNQLE